MSSSPPPTSSKYDLPFPLPVISLLDSSIYSAIFTSVYVGSLYLSKASRISPSGGGGKDKKDQPPVSRDHPEVIKARLKLVIGATVGCIFGVWGLMQYSKDIYEGNAEVVSSKRARPFPPPPSFRPFPFPLSLTPLPFIALTGRFSLPQNPSPNLLPPRFPPFPRPSPRRTHRGTHGLRSLGDGLARCDG